MTCHPLREPEKGYFLNNLPKSVLHFHDFFSTSHTQTVIVTVIVNVTVTVNVKVTVTDKAKFS